MKMTILFGNGKRGTINLVSSSIIAEDFKANICKKLKIDVNQFKLKIDFLNNEIELLAVDIIEKTIKPKVESEKLLMNVSVVYRNGEKIYLYKDCYANLRGGSIWQVRDSETQLKGNNHLDLAVIDRGVNPRTQKEFIKAVRALQIKLPIGVRLVTWNGSKHYVYKNHMITLELDYMMELFNAQKQIKNDVVLDGSGVGSLGKYTKKINSIKDFKYYVDKTNQEEKK